MKLSKKYKFQTGGAVSGECPAASLNPQLNVSNKEKAISNPDIAYNTTGGTEENACGNCTFFDVSQRMKECMQEVQETTGYCWANQFECDTAAICNKWKEGGPINDDQTSYDVGSRYTEEPETVEEVEVIEPEVPVAKYGGQVPLPRARRGYMGTSDWSARDASFRNFVDDRQYTPNLRTPRPQFITRMAGTKLGPTLGLFTAAADLFRNTGRRLRTKKEDFVNPKDYQRHRYIPKEGVDPADYAWHPGNRYTPIKKDELRDLYEQYSYITMATDAYGNKSLDFNPRYEADPNRPVTGTYGLNQFRTSQVKTTDNQLNRSPCRDAKGNLLPECGGGKVDPNALNYKPQTTIKEYGGSLYANHLAPFLPKAQDGTGRSLENVINEKFENNEQLSPYTTNYTVGVPPTGIDPNTFIENTDPTSVRYEPSSEFTNLFQEDVQYRPTAGGQRGINLSGNQAKIIRDERGYVKNTQDYLKKYIGEKDFYTDEDLAAVEKHSKGALTLGGYKQATTNLGWYNQYAGRPKETWNLAGDLETEDIIAGKKDTTNNLIGARHLNNPTLTNTQITNVALGARKYGGSLPKAQSGYQSKQPLGSEYWGSPVEEGYEYDKNEKSPAYGSYLQEMEELGLDYGLMLDQRGQDDPSLGAVPPLSGEASAAKYPRRKPTMMRMQGTRGGCPPCPEEVMGRGAIRRFERNNPRPPGCPPCDYNTKQERRQERRENRTGILGGLDFSGVRNLFSGIGGVGGNIQVPMFTGTSFGKEGMELPIAQEGVGDTPYFGGTIPPVTVEAENPWGPYYNTLSTEQKNYLRDNPGSNDAIARAIKAQASQGYGIEGNPTFTESTTDAVNQTFQNLGGLAAEATGLPALYNIAADPVGTAKGVGETLLNIGSVLNPGGGSGDFIRGLDRESERFAPRDLDWSGLHDVGNVAMASPWGSLGLRGLKQGAKFLARRGPSPIMMAGLRPGGSSKWHLQKKKEAKAMTDYFKQDPKRYEEELMDLAERTKFLKESQKSFNNLETNLMRESLKEQKLIAKENAALYQRHDILPTKGIKDYFNMRQRQGYEDILNREIAEANIGSSNFNLQYPLVRNNQRMMEVITGNKQPYQLPTNPYDIFNVRGDFYKGAGPLNVDQVGWAQTPAAKLSQRTYISPKRHMADARARFEHIKENQFAPEMQSRIQEHNALKYPLNPEFPTEVFHTRLSSMPYRGHPILGGRGDILGKQANHLEIDYLNSLQSDVSAGLRGRPTDWKSIMESPQRMFGTKKGLGFQHKLEIPIASEFKTPARGEAGFKQFEEGYIPGQHVNIFDSPLTAAERFPIKPGDPNYMEQLFKLSKAQQLEKNPFMESKPLFMGGLNQYGGENLPQAQDGYGNYEMPASSTDVALPHIINPFTTIVPDQQATISASLTDEEKRRDYAMKFDHYKNNLSEYKTGSENWMNLPVEAKVQATLNEVGADLAHVPKIPWTLQLTPSADDYDRAGKGWPGRAEALAEGAAWGYAGELFGAGLAALSTKAASGLLKGEEYVARMLNKGNGAYGLNQVATAAANIHPSIGPAMERLSNISYVVPPRGTPGGGPANQIENIPSYLNKDYWAGMSSFGVDPVVHRNLATTRYLGARKDAGYLSGNIDMWHGKNVQELDKSIRFLDKLSKRQKVTGTDPNTPEGLAEWKRLIKEDPDAMPELPVVTYDEIKSGMMEEFVGSRGVGAKLKELQAIRNRLVPEVKEKGQILLEDGIIGGKAAQQPKINQYDPAGIRSAYRDETAPIGQRNELGEVQTRETGIDVSEINWVQVKEDMKRSLRKNFSLAGNQTLRENAAATGKSKLYNEAIKEVGEERLKKNQGLLKTASKEKAVELKAEDVETKMFMEGTKQLGRKGEEGEFHDIITNLQDRKGFFGKTPLEGKYEPTKMWELISEQTHRSDMTPTQMNFKAIENWKDMPKGTVGMPGFSTSTDSFVQAIKGLKMMLDKGLYSTDKFGKPIINFHGHRPFNKMGYTSDSPARYIEHEANLEIHGLNQKLKALGIEEYMPYVATGDEPFKALAKKMGEREAKEALNVGESVYPVISLTRQHGGTSLPQAQNGFENWYSSWNGQMPDFKDPYTGFSRKIPTNPSIDYSFPTGSEMMQQYGSGDMYTNAPGGTDITEEWAKANNQQLDIFDEQEKESDFTVESDYGKGATGFFNKANQALDSKGARIATGFAADATVFAGALAGFLGQRNDRRRYEDWAENETDSASVFGTQPGGQSGQRGDFDVNSGIFRPEDKVTSRWAGYGGEILNVDDATLRKLIAAGAGIEIL